MPVIPLLFHKTLLQPHTLPVEIQLVEGVKFPKGMEQDCASPLDGSTVASTPTQTTSENLSRGTSILQSAFNISNNIVGQSILSLPAGLDVGTGLCSGLLLSLAICITFAYTFSLTGRVCQVTGGRTHKECGEFSNGQRFGLLMAVTQTLKCGCDCICCAIVIGESFSRIFISFGFSAFFTSRQVALLGITAFVIAPLCMLKDFGVLAYVSVTGLGLEVLVISFMHLRLVDGSYSQGGRFHDAIAERYRPNFEGGVNFWGVDVRTLVLFGALSRAFVAHSNAPKFFSEMRSSTSSAFDRALVLAHTIALVLYGWIMCVGYLTFGNSADGLILNNYAQSDPGATLARLAIGAAAVCCFPLNFVAFRDSTISVLSCDAESNKVVKAVTFSLLALIASVGCCAHSLGFFNSLVGALFGGLIVFVFPGMMVVGARARTPFGWQAFSRAEACVAWVLIVIGAVLTLFVSGIVCIDEYAPQMLQTM